MTETPTKAPAAAAELRRAQADTWVYFDGKLCQYGDAHLGLMTHALHYGTGCFEGIRAYWSPKQEQLHLLQAPAHYERMKRSANVLRMKLPHSTEELVDITLEVLRRNQFKADTYIRPLLFAASEEIGVRLHNLRHSFFVY